MRILITAGPTREPIDAVRFISNRSSGKMGIAIAEAAADAGHDVTLLLGPVLVHASLHDTMRVYRFGSSAELKQLLEAHFPDCDLLVMAAAVADYRMQCVAEGKIKRESDTGGTGGEHELTLRLQPTPDLVAAVASTRRPGQKIVAFSLEEPNELEERAVAKMKRKGVDAVVANPLGTMDGDHITPLWLTAAGGRTEPGSMTKPDFARWLVDRLAGL
jgi:phosphopantothenoylcysteine decarboxylase / phosphopantothenate---cysteine ligase